MPEDIQINCQVTIVIPGEGKIPLTQALEVLTDSYLDGSCTHLELIQISGQLVAACQLLQARVEMLSTLRPIWTLQRQVEAALKPITPRQYTVIREIHRNDVIADKTYPVGSILYPCGKDTCGCISDDGVAVTEDPAGGYPFFEVAKDQVQDSSTLHLP